MGAWGTKLFDDDEAADLRAGYRTYLADAQSDAGATDLSAKSFGATLDRPGDSTAFWLALGAVQWQLGRLDPRVKKACLSIIDEGIDLAKWTDPKDRGRREKVLAELRARLLSPPPPAKPMPKPIPTQLPDWEPGEVIGRRLPNGKYALIHVLGYQLWDTLKVKAPKVSVLGWFGDSAPQPAELQKLTYINHNGRFGRGHAYCLATPARKPPPQADFDRRGWLKPIEPKESISSVGGPAPGDDERHIDGYLIRILRPYWRDPTLPVQIPKSLPSGATPEEQRRFRMEWEKRLSASG
jgi:hypothetical protein